MNARNTKLDVTSSCVRDASINEDDYYLLTDRHLANSDRIVLRLGVFLLSCSRTRTILESDKFKVELLLEHDEQVLKIFEQPEVPGRSHFIVLYILQF